ncbi:hypothetical protein Sjap_005994 [Stephania japonica]|uniref:RNase H type-1 domain-containing protein n=1 Tax=Stephania japonica TaxID=461633 RepID=A0AAP0K581_9MAGN
MEARLNFGEWAAAHPTLGNCAIYADAAWNETTGDTGIGWILMPRSGSKAESMFIGGSPSVEVAECNAILCKEHHGIEKMFSDASSVIDAITSPVSICCNLDPIIFDIGNLIKDRDPLDFSYISCIHNVKADILAKSALSKRRSCIWVNPLPDFYTAVIYNYVS